MESSEGATYDPLVAQKRELAKLHESVKKRSLSHRFADMARAERINNGFARRILLSMEPRKQ
jgi:hypothetical protein